MSHSSPARALPENPGRIPRVLCVDPASRVTDGLTGLLEREGFHVDVEHDGRRALKLALAGGYDAIVAATELPRVGGLEIVRALRRELFATPVVLLAATPSVEAAIEATRLDARYLTKSAATLSQIVTALGGPDISVAPRPPELFAARETIELDRGPQQPEAAARTLAKADLTFPQFVCAAADLRAALGDGDAPAAPLCPSWTSVHPLVREALFRIEAAGSRWAQLSEGTLATALAIRTAAVCRLLHRQLGLGFLECRRAVVMRRGVRELAVRREQVAQVAYSLGYEHASSFNRDFRRFLGTSPTIFRRLTRAETDKA